MHHGGLVSYNPQRVYSGGLKSYFDFCNSDEISLVELDNMAKEVGCTGCNIYCYKLNYCVGLELINTDEYVMRLETLVDGKGVVEVYVGCLGMDGIIGSSAKRSQRKGVLVDIQVTEEEDNDDYDPNPLDSSSSDESEKYEDSDYGFSDDDALYEANVDKELEFASVGSSKNGMAEAVDDLQSLGSSFDELRSIDSSSDEGGTSHRRQ
ncbi:hypothetical protein CsSME_00034366 [Camellia sinensis var. sinensis]